MIIAVNMDIMNKINCATIYLPEELDINFSKKYLLIDMLNKKKYERQGKEVIIILEPGESHIFLVKQANEMFGNIKRVGWKKEDRMKFREE